MGVRSALFDGEAWPGASKRSRMKLTDFGCPPWPVRNKTSALWSGFGLGVGGFFSGPYKALDVLLNLKNYLPRPPIPGMVTFVPPWPH